jgi:hypothetical protein
MQQSVDAALALHVGRFYVTDQIGRYDNVLFPIICQLGRCFGPKD